MRSLLVTLLMLSLAGAATASVTGNTPASVKDPGAPYVNPSPPIRVTGDTIADPFILPSWHCTVTGTTAGFTNDYDEICPYSGSTAPDVVYRYTHTNEDVWSLDLDLCHSGYDTKLYVYDNACTPGSPYACNDDFNFAAPCFVYSSRIDYMPVVVGHTYYIVIDGYGGASGDYSMDVTWWGGDLPVGACCARIGICMYTLHVSCLAPNVWLGEGTDCDPNPCPPPPEVVCPPGSLIEGEPPCFPGYVDNYNGGCNSAPHVFQAMNPQAAGCATMCGKSCANSDSRDTDWFMSIGTGGLMTGTAVAEFPLQYMIIYGTDCANPAYTYVLGEEPGPVTLSWTVADGAEVWNWIGLSRFGDWPESDYVLEVCGIRDPPPPPGACCATNGCIVASQEVCAFFGGIFHGPGTPCEPSPCAPVPTVARSWGAIKAAYR